MITYVNTVLVSNLGDADSMVISALPKDWNGASNYDKNLPSADQGKFIFMNCDPIDQNSLSVDPDLIYNVTSSNAASINTIKIGIVTKKNNVVHLPNGTVQYLPIIKWSNEIKAADVKSYNKLTYTPDTEDVVTINFTNLNATILNKFADGGKRIIVRLTYKDLPNRYRKWTESYEYVTAIGDTKATIAYNIATMINKEWKRARVEAIVGSLSGSIFTPDANWGTSTPTTGTVIKLTALPYDDDDANETLNWAAKVRFNANVYWTDPAGDGWESTNKNFPVGVSIDKIPGKQYAASAKLVRDQESKAQGYLGILNRGEGTWPIIKPEIEANINAHYDGITLEFENMYRAADDIFRKTKQTVEIYGLTTQLSDVETILNAFVDYKQD